MLALLLVVRARSRTEFQKYELAFVKHNEEKKHLKSQLKKTQASIEKDAKKQSEVQAEIDKMRQDVPRHEAKEREVTELIQKTEAEMAVMYETIKVETEPVRNKIEAKQREREPKAQSLDKIKAEAELNASEARILAEKQEQGEAELATAERELQAHDEAVERSGKELSACEAERTALQRRAEAATAQEATWKQQEEALVAEESSCRSRYNEGKASLSNASSRTTVLRALHKAKKDGTVPGIIDRLGSLGSIPAEYDVAISTACSALEHIVVDNTTTAQKCVDLMRKNNLGIATFIALDRQQHLQPKLAAAFAAPKGSERLVDLVECDEAHRVAFYFALQDTLVCRDEETAKKVAFDGAKRNRVVTTDGVVINKSGSMEGGGRPQRGRMSAQQTSGEELSEKQLEELRTRADKAGRQLEELRATRAGAQPELRSLQKAIKAQEVAHKKLQMHLDSATTQRKALEERLERVRATAGTSLSAAEISQQKELAARAKELQKKVDAEQKAVDKMDAELATLQEQVLAAGGVRLREKKSRVETLREELACAQQAITKAKVSSESLEKQETKLKAAVAKQTAAVAELEAQIESTKEKFKELEDKALVVMEKYKSCEDELAAKEDTAKRVQEEYEAFKQIVEKVRLVEKDMAIEAEKVGASIKDNQQKVKNWREKLRKLREEAAQQAAELAAAGSEAAAGEAGEAAAGEASEAAEGAGERLVDLTPEQLDAIDAQELLAETTQLEETLEAMSPNLSAIAEYRKREGEWRARLKDFDDVTAERDEARRTHDELRKLRLDEFMAGYKEIGMRLKEMYLMITFGGAAELELADSTDPFSEGIVFSVRPPGKSWKVISNLSGGEKTLASLALVFALHHYKPTPLYVMDEIDAALDFRNVSIVGNYIKERTKNAQFIIISLRNNMFELADRLVGIYKTNDCTKSVAINPSAFTLPLARVAS